MTQQEIDKKLDIERQEEEQRYEKMRGVFYGSKYEGELPELLRTTFKKAVFHTAILTDNIHSEGLKKDFINADFKNISKGAVGKMLDIIGATSRSNYADTLEEAIEIQATIEPIQKDLFEQLQVLENQIAEERKKFVDKQNRKRMAMYNQPGTNGGNVMQNKMNKAEA